MEPQAPNGQLFGEDRTAVYPASAPNAVGPSVLEPASYDPGAHPGSPGGPPGDPSRSAVLIAVLAILTVALVGIVAYLVTSTGGSNTEAALIPVPTVIGETQATATNRLADLGFTVTVEFQDSERGEPGTVFAQIPEGGTDHDPAEPVVLFVVVGDETATVPDVIDRQADAAQAELTALGFTVTTVEEPSDDVDLGRVIRQSIQPGQEANVGSTITLTVSSGAGNVEVPDVTGQPQALAERTVADAGLVPVVEPIDVAQDSQSIGDVVSQIPRPGQSTSPGSEVLLRVGRAVTTGTTSAPTTATTARPTTTAPTTATTSPSTSTTSTVTQPVGADTPEALLISFGEAWDSADWELMRTLATEPVVSTAMEWYDEGGSANLDQESVARLLETCFPNPSGPGTTCEFVYAPARGFGLIFDITYTQTPSGWVATNLVFGGDAG